MSLPPDAVPADADPIDASIRKFWHDFVMAQLRTGRRDVGRMLETAMEFFFERSTALTPSQTKRQAEVEKALAAAHQELKRLPKDQAAGSPVHATLATLGAKRQAFAEEVASHRQRISQRLHVLSPSLYATGQTWLADMPPPPPQVAEMIDDQMPQEAPPPQEQTPEVEATPSGPASWLQALSAMPAKVGRAFKPQRSADEEQGEASPSGSDSPFREFEDIAASWLKPPKK